MDEKLMLPGGKALVSGAAGIGGGCGGGGVCILPDEPPPEVKPIEAGVVKLGVTTAAVDGTVAYVVVVAVAVAVAAEVVVLVLLL